MPQLHPAPWLITLIAVWLTLLWLLHLIVKLFNPSIPNKPLTTYYLTSWTWTWQ